MLFSVKHPYIPTTSSVVLDYITRLGGLDLKQLTFNTVDSKFGLKQNMLSTLQFHNVLLLPLLQYLLKLSNSSTYIASIPSKHHLISIAISNGCSKDL